MIQREFLLAMLLCTGDAAVAATVSGRVMDEKNRPVMGATVWIHVRPDGSVRPTPYSAWAQSGPGGVFRIPDVPAGQYSACVRAANGPYVDGCMWGTPARFSVASNPQVNIGALQIAEGHDFRVRIDDPRGELNGGEGGARQTDLKIGLWTSRGFFCPLPVKHRSPNGIEYGGIVPYGDTIRLSIRSEMLTLKDERGEPVRRGQEFRQAFLVKPGKKASEVRFELRPEADQSVH
ncbi:MAG: carboxypeptidase-like regulatory domain-containing protein [Fimbriimonadaceae bacterium]